MADAHDLAVAFDTLANAVAAEKAKLEVQNIPVGARGYNDWQQQIANLATQYDHLEDAATKLDTAYAEARLAGLQAQLQSIANATNQANAVVAEIAGVNKVLSIVAAAVAAAAAVAVTIANPAVGIPTLMTSGQALLAAINAAQE